MFGTDNEDDYYFFYMRFKPATSYYKSGDSFQMWFQIGDTSSDWQGVSCPVLTADIASGSTYTLSKVSASNTDFASLVSNIATASTSNNI